MDYNTMSEVLKALGHPIRLQIADGLTQNECNVSKITTRLGLPQSTASQHLGILKACGIIAARKEGVKTCYRVVDPKVIKLLGVLKG